jgi:hypothetical protein
MAEGMQVDPGKTNWKARPSASSPESKKGGKNDESSEVGKRARANTAGDTVVDIEGHGTSTGSKGGSGKGKGKGGRRRRRTQVGRKPEHIKSSDPNLRYVLSIMARLSLQTQSMVRTCLGLLLTTIIMDKNIEPAVSALAEQEQFKLALRELRSNDANDNSPLGPPHLQIFHSFMQGLAKAEDIGAPNRTTIQCFVDETDQSADPAAYIADHCQSFQCFNVRNDDKKCRLQIAMPAGTVRSSVMKAIDNIAGARVSSGPAPRGYLEEELSDWVSMLDVDAKKPGKDG